MRRILLCALHAAAWAKDEDNVVVPYYDAFAGFLVPERDLEYGQRMRHTTRAEGRAGICVAKR